MGAVIIRNDDVNPNTNYSELMEMYDLIERYVPNAEIWTAWCPTCVANKDNRLFPKECYPLSGQPTEFFYRFNRFGLPHEGGAYRRLVAHGLMHFNHQHVDVDTQVASIVGSARMLRTNIFVPPFSSFNEDTESICKRNSITLVKPSDGWKSLESEQFDKTHNLWFFHSWRFTVQSLEEVFKNMKKSFYEVAAEIDGVLEGGAV